MTIMALVRQNQYSTHFKVKQFLRTWHSNIDDPIAIFRLKQRHIFFKGYSSKSDSDGNARMLEFGGGPTIVDHISAAPHVAEIIHTVYTEGERKEIEMWMNDSEGAHDWTFAFKHVVNELESNKGESAWKKRKELLHSKLKVTTGDITKDHPIGITEDHASFSFISTSFCLESVCKTYTDYKIAIKKLAKLLKVGGYMIMQVVESESFYVVGDEKWSVLPVSLDQVREALEEAGFVLLIVERDPVAVESTIQNPIASDKKSVMFLAALKQND